MLTTEALIAVMSLLLSAFGLGYTLGYNQAQK